SIAASRLRYNVAPASCGAGVLFAGCLLGAPAEARIAPRRAFERQVIVLRRVDDTEMEAHDIEEGYGGQPDTLCAVKPGDMKNRGGGGGVGMCPTTPFVSAFLSPRSPFSRRFFLTSPQPQGREAQPASPPQRRRGTHR